MPLGFKKKLFQLKKILLTISLNTIPRQKMQQLWILFLILILLWVELANPSCPRMSNLMLVKAHSNAQSHDFVTKVYSNIHHKMQSFLVFSYQIFQTGLSWSHTKKPNLVSRLGVWSDEENIVRVLWENQSHFHTNQVVKVSRASAAIL